MKTYLAKDGDITDKWFVVDAEGKTLGRLATRVADILRGKNKPQFTPNVDTGDFVIIINAASLRIPALLTTPVNPPNRSLICSIALCTC